MSAPGYVLKNRRTTLERGQKFISSTEFTDVNLYGKLYPCKADICRIQHCAVSGLITTDPAVTFEEATNGTFEDTHVGASFGPTWTTHWFRLEIEIPEHWGLGPQVMLVWDSGSEAMVWKDGKPLQGLSPGNKRTEFVLNQSLNEASFKHTLYVEMACSGLFGAGQDGLINPPDREKYFTLRRADIVMKSPEIHRVLIHFEVLIGLIENLPEESNRSYQLLYAVNDMVNACRTSYERAEEIAEGLLSQTNSETQHTLCAVGHCHIDTGCNSCLIVLGDISNCLYRLKVLPLTTWLWPYEETKRKCARSWSSTIRLMRDYPELVFVCSQAQQFDWVKENYPSLYADIQNRAAEQRFIPVGGTWVEMDGNIPSGESFLRQFLYGQQFFEQEFGKRCTEFWLPDTFGYSAQLPQIMKQAGIERFLTQKLSWNLVNKFPHHTFWWKGLDGSRVLTHFPPGDSYLMEGTVEEVMRSLNNFKDKGRSNRSMFLFGHGDGGQGPTADMLERLKRMKNVDGIPKVEMCSPASFFSAVERQEADNLCSWNGELFLELHNGTYTTQFKLKQENRRAEILMRHVELVATLAYVVRRRDYTQYPSDEIQRLWKNVLLNQFHDVLPGTSIREVCDDAKRLYEAVQTKGSALFSRAANDLIRKEHSRARNVSGDRIALVMNTCSWNRSEVVLWPMADDVTPSLGLSTDSAGAFTQRSVDGRRLVFLSDVPSVGHCVLKPAVCGPTPVTVEKQILSSTSFLRNAVAVCCVANQFVIFDDVPLFWDAWDVMDYHLETRRPIADVTEGATIVESGPLRAMIKVSLRISDNSKISQSISLDAGATYLKFATEMDWHESHKFLKVEFPLNIRSPHVTYEIQFGHVQRPNHFNTSWDSARFEVCGHKWADLSEYDWGVAVLNDSHYGWSCVDSVLRLSLLRSSKAPDETADMGHHQFVYALMPHDGTYQAARVIQAAYELNEPLVCITPECDDVSRDLYPDISYFSVDSPAVILETVKKTEESDSVILRLYEAYGGTTTARVRMAFNVKHATLCNALEDSPGRDVEMEGRDCLVLRFSPFQIVSVMLTPSSPG